MHIDYIVMFKLEAEAMVAVARVDKEVVAPMIL